MLVVVCDGEGTAGLPSVEKGRSVAGCWLLDRRWRLIEEVVSPCSAVREEAGAEGEGFGEMGRRGNANGRRTVSGEGLLFG